MSKQQKLYRSPKDGILAGVASGFAHYFAMDVTLMRIIFGAVIIISHGAGLVLYVALALIMPIAGDKSAAVSFNERVENLAEEVKVSGRLYNMSTLLGIGVILLGVWLLITQFFPYLLQVQWSIVWAIVVILIGTVIITRSKK